MGKIIPHPRWALLHFCIHVVPCWPEKATVHASSDQCMTMVLLLVVVLHPPLMRGCRASIFIPYINSKVIHIYSLEWKEVPSTLPIMIVAVL